MHALLQPFTRRRPRAIVLATVFALLASYLVVLTVSSAGAAATLLSQGKPATASSSENAGMAAADAVDGNTGTRWSSAFSDPQWIQVDLGATATHQPGRAALGGRLRRGVPDPDLDRQRHVDHDLHHDHRHRRRPDPERHRHPAATCGCTAPSARPATATRCGSSRSTARPARTGCGTTNAALGRPATASSTENAGIPRVRGHRRQHRHPLVERVQRPAVDPGRPRQHPDHLPGRAAAGRPPTPARSRSRCRPTGPPGPRSTPPRPAPAAPRPSTVTGTGRYVRMYGTARATAYGYSLWEFIVRTRTGP